MKLPSPQRPSSPKEVASHIDVNDLNYLYTSEKLNSLGRQKGLSVRGRWRCAFLFLAQTAKSLFREIRRSKRLPNEGSVLFVIESRNQRNAVAPVAEKISDAAELSVKGFGDGSFPTLAAYLASIRYLPRVLREFRAATGYLRLAYEHVGHELLLTRGWYVVARRHLSRMRPSVLVLANDHNMRNRVLRLAAEHEGVPTVYIPHASVTADFPPLSFDYAFLEGKDMLCKYREAGQTSTTSFLLGIPRLDRHVDRRSGQIHDSAAVRLAVCANLLDDSDSIVALIDGVSLRMPQATIEFRPHPRDYRPWGRLLGDRPVHVSDARSEVSFEFLPRQDVIVAGDSNIVLEAALIGVYPIQYAFGREFEDYYQFVRRGIATFVADLESFLQLLEDGSRNGWPVTSVKKNAAWYNANSGTEFEGRASELAASLLGVISNAAEKERFPTSFADKGTVFALNPGAAAAPSTPTAPDTVWSNWQEMSQADILRLPCNQAVVDS